ncbi:hypothetical protein ABIE00_000115 [Arthrobacter sp. OAP107]
MSFQVTPESGGRPPRRLGCRPPDDSGMGMASLVCGALVVPSMVVTTAPATLVMLVTRPDSGRSGREWVASAVFFTAPAMLTLLSLVYGLVALGRAPRRSKGFKTGAAGLVLAGLEAVFILLPSIVRGY